MVTANYPTSHFPAAHAAAYEQCFFGGFVGVPNDPSQGGTSIFHARDLFEPWLRDIGDTLSCKQAIIIVNYTGYTLKLSGTPHYDGGSLISQPILPDGLTVNTIPPAYMTDRAAYLGMGRFVQDDGSIFYGSGIGMTMNASQGTFTQDFGIFVAASVNGGYGLDVCANMANVDVQTRYDNGAGKQKTQLNTRMTDRSGSLYIEAVILDRATPAARKGMGDAMPLVLVRITG